MIIDNNCENLHELEVKICIINPKGWACFLFISFPFYILSIPFTSFHIISFLLFLSFLSKSLSRIAVVTACAAESQGKPSGRRSLSASVPDPFLLRSGWRSDAAELCELDARRSGYIRLCYALTLTLLIRKTAKIWVCSSF